MTKLVDENALSTSMTLQKGYIDTLIDDAHNAQADDWEELS